MGSCSKCSRLSEDRISNLPNEIIGYILSFLSTEDAVATSILSKRWVNAWNYITTLDLSDDFIPPRTFTSIMYRVLLLCKALCLHKFRLQFRRRDQASDVKSWINYALGRNVKHLDISAKLKVSFELFSSTTLTVLKLDALEISMNISSTFCLPNVKIVHLCPVRFSNDDQFTRFVCGYPVLEELHLEEFIGSDLHAINIVAPLLKRLILFQVFNDRYGDDGVDYDDISYKIIINAPSLVYLELKGCSADLFTIVDSLSLLKQKFSLIPMNGHILKVL